MRAFVVGNGPSLKHTPLDKLIGETTFATNRIHLIYPKTEWRPTYYIRAEEMSMPDPEVWRDDLLINLANRETSVWANVWFAKWLDRMGCDYKGRINTLRLCAHYQLHFDSKDAPHMWHLPYLCGFGSSVNVAIQMAAQMGLSPIYLVGCDLGYTSNGDSHFHPDYQKGYKDQLREPRYANMDTLHAHMIAARSSPVPIYNATIGGALEAYPRVNLEDIL